MALDAADRERGFSLVELVVSLALASLVLGGAFAMFNFTNKLSRAQLHQSDLQQSSRAAQRELVRTVRMAGRGGLPGHHVAGHTATSGPASITPAIEVRNNVPSASQRLVDGNESSPLVVENTDVLTVRGHFNSPLLFVRSTDPASFDPSHPSGGKIRISSRSPGGVPQDLGALVEAVNNQRPDAILIVSALSDLIYGVAEIDWSSSNVSSWDPDPRVASEIEVAYKNRGGIHTSRYGLLSAEGVFPDSAIGHPDWLPPRDLANVGSVALLEEYRFYVRDPENGDAPRLSVGRFYPGTDVAHPSGGWSSDLADNIRDLQVALGFDSSFDGSGSFNGFFAFDPDNLGNDDLIVDGDVLDGTNTALDDWLFNDAADAANLGSLPWTPAAAAGTDPPSFTVSQPRPRLYYARVTTLTMAASGDRGYQAPEVTAIEDHAYTTTTDDPVNGFTGRQHRRLLLTTIVDLRNL